MIKDLNKPHRNVLKALLAIMLAAAIALALSSCGSTKKHISTSKSSSDSTATAAVSKSGNKTTVSEGGKTILDSHDSEAIIEFEGDAQQLAKDYAGDTAAGGLTKKNGRFRFPKFTHKIGGTSIETNRPIKRIIIKDSGIRKEFEVNKTTTTEASKQDSSGSTSVVKKEESKEKNVKRTSWQVPVILFSLLLIYLAIAFKFWLFPFALISRREREQLNQKS
jgi:uncharacterized protein YceK